ncbi:MAG: hypothetical protein E7165_04090 [Firmicutes bacterium]|nr:hypothetical protein [Bacillota bacterium]
MKNMVINGLMKFVSSNKNLTETQKEELKFGFSSIYITYTKLIVITLVAIILGLFKEYLFFLLAYNLIRTFSFGLHATKSWMCWISSTIIFLIIPYICRILVIPQIVKIIVGSLLIIQFAINSPADTKKRPIVSQKRRIFFKYVSTLLCFIYILISIITKDNLISNILFFTTLVQSIIINPYTYKLFKMPYNNYKNYITE